MLKHCLRIRLEMLKESKEFFRTSEELFGNCKKHTHIHIHIINNNINIDIDTDIIY